MGIGATVPRASSIGRYSRCKGDYGRMAGTQEKCNLGDYIYEATFSLSSSFQFQQQKGITLISTMKHLFRCLQEWNQIFEALAYNMMGFIRLPMRKDSKTKVGHFGLISLFYLDSHREQPY